jgi:hypothetical protein
MKNENLNNILDKGVMALMLLSLSITLSCIFVDVFFPEKSDLSDAVFYSPYHLILTLLIGILLILWITVGEGLSSKLWNWLPPFLFFKNSGNLGKITVVLTLVLVILLGLINDLFDIY